MTDISKVEKALPPLLMGLGVGFGGAATVTGISGTFDAVENGYSKSYFLDKSVPLKEKVKVVGRHYGLTGALSVISLGCFIAAERGYSSELTKLAGAASVASYYAKQYEEYRKKNRELYGEENDKTIQKEMAKDDISKNPPPKKRNDDAYLIYDPITKQYFEASQKEVDHCEREMNRILGKQSSVHYGYLLKHFRGVNYELPICEELGWFLDETFADYYYWNESFYGRPYFEIWLDPEETPNGEVYILRCSIEPMLNLDVDLDVVKDSEDRSE